ncbi:MAG: polyketide cyclase [Deltaproteobacteria bacterium HGW-Deltaproteobacteria-22]|jgi:predicted ester cyclase|nr:MAG: polyketide cyclase [Deltaproteobacteria bacterium HGW-Deltaproteobacteria-22]
MQQHQNLVRRFYTDVLTVNPNHRPEDVLAELLAEDFRSVNAAEVKNKAMLSAQVGHFWRLIPDLRWEVEEMLQAGDRVIVRSTATGTPRGEFMGLSLDGSRSFRIMTIDIHTVRDGRISEVYHQEEWATALRQLRG